MPALSLRSAKILFVVATLGVAPILTSCKRGPTREQREIAEHFDKPKREEAALKKKIEEHFRDTPYTFEVSNTLVGGSLREGAVSKDDLLAMKFSLLILYSGASTPEQREEIDQGLRSVLSPEQYQDAIIGTISSDRSEPGTE